MNAEKKNKQQDSTHPRPWIIDHHITNSINVCGKEEKESSHQLAAPKSARVVLSGSFDPGGFGWSGPPAYKHVSRYGLCFMYMWQSTSGANHNIIHLHRYSTETYLITAYLEGHKQLEYGTVIIWPEMREALLVCNATSQHNGSCNVIQKGPQETTMIRKYQTEHTCGTLVCTHSTRLGASCQP